MLSPLTVRDWECACGCRYTRPVTFDKYTSNLSSERTQWCPRCGKRPLMGSPHYVLHARYPSAPGERAWWKDQ